MNCRMAALALIVLQVPYLVMAGEPTASVPKTDPSEWVTNKDYPLSEMGRGASGVTAFALAVDRNGVVTDCRITGSSGFVGLDATACALLKARGRFIPARDGNGRKIESVWTNRVRWQIPRDAKLNLPPPKQEMAIQVDIDEKGVVEHCEILDAAATAQAGLTSPCMRYPDGLKVHAYTGPDGKAAKMRMTLRQTVEFAPR